MLGFLASKHVASIAWRRSGNSKLQIQKTFSSPSTLTQPTTQNPLKNQPTPHLPTFSSFKIHHFTSQFSFRGAHPPTVVHPTRRSSSPPAAPLAPTRRARTRAGRSRAPPAPPTRSPRRESTPPPPSPESTRSPGWPPPPRRPRPARRRAQEQKSVKIHQPQIFSPAACSNIPCMRRAARSRTLQVGSSAGRSS